MKIAYFDCFAGASGDMILGALLDLGLNKEALFEELKKLPIDGYEISVKDEVKLNIKAKRVEIIAKDQGKRRGLKEIREIIGNSRLSEEVKKVSIEIFERLARAEAKIHGVSPDEVHFHEIGAIDSIVDVVGSVIGIRYHGIEVIFSSRIPIGDGFIEGEHGTLPVPAPATAELLKGIPIYHNGIGSELITPTGAAILSTLSKGFGEFPPMTLEKVGYGAGRRDLEGIPNVLRIFIGYDEGGYKRDKVYIIETNIDDMNPEFYEILMEELFSKGALDVFMTNIHMKKSRPGILLNVIGYARDLKGLIDTIYKFSTSIGVRYYEADRIMLDRKIEYIETRYGKVGVKIAFKGDRIINYHPEYEDCKRICREKGIPLKDIYNEINGVMRWRIKS